MELSLIFVYHNEEKKKIKVLNLNEAKSKSENLLAKGWKLTATLDSRRWIEYLFNECEPEDVIANIRELHKP